MKAQKWYLNTKEVNFFKGRKECKLFVVLLLKNSNSDTKITWWQTEAYGQTVGLTVDIPSLQQTPRPFIKWFSYPKHCMYIISVKSHNYPTCTHYYIRFTQIQKLGPRQAYLFAQDKQSNSVTELIRKSGLIPKHVTISLCQVPSHKTVSLTISWPYVLYTILL